MPTKVLLVKAMVLPVVMNGCERWTIKKAESWRIDTFELWRWRRLLRVPWTARRANQSILKEINPEYSLEGLMLSWNCNTLATWCKELTHWKRPWCWERLKAGGEGDNREWDGWMTAQTQWTWVWASSRSWRTGTVHRVTKSRTQLSDWTELTNSCHSHYFPFLNGNFYLFFHYLSKVGMYMVWELKMEICCFIFIRATFEFNGELLC